MYDCEGAMKVSKWGNSLGVRLPQAVVDALNLKAGDDIEVAVAGARRVEIRRDSTKMRALERLRALSRPLPLGFVFDRDEANVR
jgi:antitoxin MazE